MYKNPFCFEKFIIFGLDENNAKDSKRIKHAVPGWANRHWAQFACLQR